MLGLNFTFCSKLKVPAWRSILALAKGSYLGGFAWQGMSTVAQQRSHIFEFMAGAFCFGKICDGEGRKGANHNKHFFSQCLFEFIIFPLLAMFVIEFIHLILAPLFSSPRCSSLVFAICRDSSWTLSAARIVFPGGTNEEVSKWNGWCWWKESISQCIPCT